MKKPGPRFWPNRLRNWPFAKGSFFVVKNSDGIIPPPPVETFFILTEGGDLMLQENDDAILTELAP